MTHFHDTMTKVGSYIHAQFGGLIKDLTKESTVIHKHFEKVSTKGKAMLLNAYLKLRRKITGLRTQVLNFVDPVRSLRP